MQEDMREVDKKEIFKSLIEEAKKELLRRYQALSPEQRRALLLQYNYMNSNNFLNAEIVERNRIEEQKSQDPEYYAKYYEGAVARCDNWRRIMLELQYQIYTNSSLPHNYYMNMLHTIAVEFEDKAEKQGITVSQITDDKISLGGHIRNSLHHSHELFKDPTLLVNEAQNKLI